MIAYLSGSDHHALADAATALRAVEVEVISPHEKDVSNGLHEALRADAEALVGSDVVVVLPGWEDSKGCVIEVTLAHALRIPVLPLAEALLSLDPETSTYRPVAV